MRLTRYRAILFLSSSSWFGFEWDIAMGPSPQKGYIPHLDGIRAVALIGVLLFHFQCLNARGGFVGVDAFLVLSGFLVTRIIVRGIQQDTFDVVSFWKRRFWRLYPCLLATASLTLLVSLQVQTGDLFIGSTKSVLASLGFSSNFLFLAEDGYFDEIASRKPLLHTWSLGLEEQFYIIWPLILQAAWHFSAHHDRGQVIAAALTSFLSLAYAIAEKNPSTKFFMLPARLVEFGVGGVASFFYSRLSSASIGIQNVVGLLGFLALVSSFFTMDESISFPSPAYGLPVFGTLAMIICPGSQIAAVLACAPLRWIGKLSYSGYLVHWGIYVFSIAVLKEDDIGTSVHIAFLFLATLGFALLLHHSVENRFRFSRTVFQETAMFVVWLATIAAGLWIVGSNAIQGMQETNYKLEIEPLEKYGMCGDPKPFTGKDVSAMRKDSPYFKRFVWEPDMSGNMYREAEPEERVFSEVDREGKLFGFIGDVSRLKRPSAFLFGSSYIEHFWFGFQSIALSLDETILVQAGQRCPLFPREYSQTLKSIDDLTGSDGSKKQLKHEKVYCAKQTKYRWDYIDEYSDAKTIVMAHKWDSFFEGWAGEDPDRIAHVAKHFLGTLLADVRKIGRKLVIIGSTPGTAHMSSSEDSAKPVRFRAVESSIRSNNALRTACESLSSENLKFIDLAEFMCDRNYRSSNASCLVRVPGHRQYPMYRDGHHLSQFGSDYLSPILNSAIY